MDSPVSEQTFAQVDAETLRNLVRQSLSRRRQAIVFTLAKRFLSCLNDLGVGESQKVAVLEEGWKRIESLSQLRALVGGRFQNLKHKWTEAGFPLREHRGDREGKAEVNPGGWLELALWIDKQGFEVRLAREEDPWLFEVRSHASK